MWYLSDIGLLVLRLVLGLVVAAHGSQKMLGWFGGNGLPGHAAFMQMMGIRPSGLFAAINAMGEFFGGLGIAAGLLTPLAAAGPIGSMSVAVISVHWRKGFWNHGGGFEYPFVLAAVSFVIGLIGPGRYSLDAALGIRFPEPWTYIIVLAATALVVIYTVTRRVPPAPQSQA